MIDHRENIRLLTELKAQQPAKVSHMCLSSEDVKRLGAMGLHVGSVVTLMVDSPDSDIVVVVGSSKIALSHDVAQKIYVY